MTFGAGELQTLVAQLNAWTPQIETAIQELRGAQLVMSGQMQRLVESGENELTNIVVAFRSELDFRAAERVQHDEALKQELRDLVAKVHDKFVEVETAIKSLAAMTAPGGQTVSSGAAGVNQGM